MLSAMRETITQTLSLVEINIDQDMRRSLMMPGMQPDPQEMQETREDPALQGTGAQVHDPQGTSYQPQKPIKYKQFDKNDPATWARTPRNAQCPCGSGKKYKHCHGKIRVAQHA